MTILYLEWYRARQLQRRDLSEDKKKWWRWQRTHGLCMAIRQATEQADLQEIAKRLETPTGMQRLKRLLAQSKRPDGKLTKDDLPERLRDRFDKIDANHDGLIDEQELRDWLATVQRRLEGLQNQ